MQIYVLTTDAIETVWVDAKLTTKVRSNSFLASGARLDSNVLGPFGSMNKIRTDPEWEVEIKQRIEWVHAQTAMRHYKFTKKAGDDGEGEGDNIDRMPISQSLNQQRKRNMGSNENFFLNHW